MTVNALIEKLQQMIKNSEIVGDETVTSEGVYIEEENIRVNKAYREVDFSE